MPGRLAEFETRGFLIFASVLPEWDLAELRCEADAALAQSKARSGARHLLKSSVLFSELARTGAVANLARGLLGPDARAIKLTLFNKTPAANWKVPWHQDTMIPVRNRRDAEGFSAWSKKGGCWHVRPPVEILERILAIRVHLDDTPEQNGALRVLPGSHRQGVLGAEAIAQMRRWQEMASCPVPAGGAMAMRPLLLHASSEAERPENRRVLHFEYTTQALPDGLEWPPDDSTGVA